ncbi:MAG TPA: glycosyltransferase [Candidatus Limnocylindrales bacterium]|nr:glycosyltransferase [Candidatus Limnocylindrales bacterium]
MSVVIPVHNPGRYIEPCIRSLLRQSISRDRFEVVFVDDGSTDGTGARLDRLAREQPHVRVIHIAASGAPGRPRNVGLEAALGEYVQFLDADDELAPKALQRLLRMARTNHSDIVLGKFASETMTRRQDLFTRTRGATTLEQTPQLADGSMGPTKLFRAALLREHEISFPEGWRQMEDQLFTLRAYLAARVISILGDEPCYFFNKREDEGHISSELVDPATHAAHLREIVDEIDRGVDDPALRRRFLARFYRVEILARLAGEQFTAAPSSYRAELFDALRPLARERFAEVADGLGAVARVRSQLLQDGSPDALFALAERAAAFTLDARVSGAAWANGRLGIDFRAILSRGPDARPLALVERDGALLLDPELAEDLVGPVEVTGELGAIRAQVSVVDRETSLEWIIPGGAGLTIRPAGDPDDELRVPTLSGFVELDPQRVGPGEQPLEDGAWDVQIRWSGLGLQAAGPLRLSRRARTAAQPVIQPALLGQPIRWAVPRAGHDGTLRIGLGGPDRAPARIDEDGRYRIRDGAGMAVELPIATDRSGTVAGGVLRLSGPGGSFDLPATFSGELGQLVVETIAGADTSEVPRGRYELTGHVGGPVAPPLPVGAVSVRDDGQLLLVGLRGVNRLARFQAWAGWSMREAGDGARARVMSAARQLPVPVKDVIRGVYGRLRS